MQPWRPPDGESLLRLVLGGSEADDEGDDSSLGIAEVPVLARDAPI
jgi:hypothetical protein